MSGGGSAKGLSIRPPLVHREDVTPEERIEELEKENERLRSENAGLRADLEKVKRDIESWRRGFKERTKRRTSQRESGPRPPPKKAGRKPGHPAARRPAPTEVDREQRHPTPATCACGGSVEATDEEVSTLEVDIPPVTPVVTKHTTRIGCCRACRARVVARLPGASPNGTTVATVTFGPNVQSLALSLRFDLSAPLGKLGAFLGRWFGVSASPGGLARMFDRLGQQAAPAVEEITAALRGAPVVGIDETGLRQNGAKGWCWVARTDKLSLFRVELSRGRWVAESILGKDFAGVVVSDFLSVYTDQGTWKNALCGAHVIREAKKIAELQPSPMTEEFRDRVRAFYKAGEEAQKSGDFYARRGVRIRLGHLLGSTDYTANVDITTLQERLRVHHVGVTRFLDNPAVPWHNNATERDVRIVARHRAVTGGTRSFRGSATTATWLSINTTRQKNGLELAPFVHAMWSARLADATAPSVFVN